MSDKVDVIAPNTVEMPAYVEIAVRWVPATGQIQVASTASDGLIQMGMLEMAKFAIQAQSGARAQTPLIVPPGRFKA